MLSFLIGKHFWTAASVAPAAAVNSNIKTLLANGWNTFFIKGKPVFIDGPKSLPNFELLIFLY